MSHVDVSIEDGRQKVKFVVPMALIGMAIAAIIAWADLKADVRHLQADRVNPATLATKADVEAVGQRVDAIYTLLAGNKK